jgi:exonuclease VII large subunit
LTARIRGLAREKFCGCVGGGRDFELPEAQSGHIYFTLKDDKAQVKCVWFRQQMRGIKFRPQDGLKVDGRAARLVCTSRVANINLCGDDGPGGARRLQLALSN